MRLTLSLGHLRLDLAICEPEDEPDGYVVISTADTELAPDPEQRFGFCPDPDEE